MSGLEVGGLLQVFDPMPSPFIAHGFLCLLTWRPTGEQRKGLSVVDPSVAVSAGGGWATSFWGWVRPERPDSAA